jgi:uncharacterized protein YjiK
MGTFYFRKTFASAMIVVIPTFVLMWAGSASAAKSIAGLLKGYRISLSVKSISGIIASNISGVALQYPSRKLFLVDNSTASIIELTTAGTVVRTITTQGISDPEGLTHYRDNIFFLAEERISTIFRIEIPATGTGPLNLSSAPLLCVEDIEGNVGTEGVSYCSTNNTLFAVKETNPSRLYRISLDEKGTLLTSTSNAPFSLEDHEGDAADIAALNDGTFIILNQEKSRLEGYDATGKLCSSLSLDMNQPEGIAVDSADGTIYVVGEQRELCVLKPPVVVIGLTTNTTSFHQPSIIEASMVKGQLSTTINLAKQSVVTLRRFSIDGTSSLLYRGTLGGGRHSLRLSVENHAPGIHFLQLTTGTTRQVLTVTCP